MIDADKKHLTQITDEKVEIVGGVFCCDCYSGFTEYLGFAPAIITDEYGRQVTALSCLDCGEVYKVIGGRFKNEVN